MTTFSHSAYTYTPPFPYNTFIGHLEGFLASAFNGIAATLRTLPDRDFYCGSTPVICGTRWSSFRSKLALGGLDGFCDP